MAVRESKLIVALVDKLTGPSRAVSSALGRLNAMAATNAAKLSAVRGQMMDAVGAGYVLAQSLSAPINAAIKFESAMSDIAKVVDFGSDSAFAKMSADIREMSLRIPIAADGIADIVAAAGQSGIKQGELAQFAEMAAKVSTAWDTSAGETGEALAKLKTGLGLTLDETGLLADSINHLSNNSAAAAPDILKVVKTTAASAKQFGFTAEQAAAIGTAMIGSGFEAEVAATSFMNVGRALTKGASATGRQTAALKKIGLTSRGVAKSMQKDAMGTLQNVLARINKVAPEMRAALISDLFGDEARALSPLVSNGSLLADTLGLIADKNSYAGSSAKEFANASKRTANALKLFRNRVNDLAISVGDALLPGLNRILELVGPQITNISELAQKYPGLTAAITGTVSALVALRIALTALRFAGLFAFGSVLSAGIGALGGASAILSGVSGALTALGAALATVSAPVLLAVGVGIAAIGAAGAYLWAKWDRISSIVTGAARAIGDELKPVIDMLQPVLEPFSQSFRAIGDAANWAWTQIKEVSTWLGGLFGKEDLTRQHEMALEDGAYALTQKIIAAFKSANAAIFSAGAEMVQALWDGMLSKVDALIEWVKTIPQRIKAAIGDIDYFGGIKSYFGGGGEPSVDGARANGGPVRGGGTYLVGERGPELFSPNRSGLIVPNHALGGGSGGGGGTNVMHYSPNFYITGGQANPEELARMADRELGRVIKANLGASWGYGD